ncbi:hydroxyacylglutathione hydrolase [Octadecabacter sp. R77987]|uniref:hydroxyacylglutathione hydrolase n=1 Tax=Octadecabacter sp. R77987 TaxID=3093874 RepID=UPI00366D8EC6
MPLEIVTVPCLSDNYAFLIHNSATGQTALVDAPEAAPVQTVLDARGWTLTDVVLTHHHWDHVDGLPPLRRDDVRVIGANADAHRLPPLDLAVADGDIFDLCGESAEVFDVSGHTLNHIAVFVPAAKAAFTADSLMAMGCGRLFEGTPQQMWHSMQKLRELPDDTMIFSGHEYTATNAKFALSIEPDNPDIMSRSRAVDAARAKGKATVPSLLADEKRTNPYLRADDPALMAAIGMHDAPATAVFAEVRKRKDIF